MINQMDQRLDNNYLTLTNTKNEIEKNKIMQQIFKNENRMNTNIIFIGKTEMAEKDTFNFTKVLSVTNDNNIATTFNNLSMIKIMFCYLVL